MSAKIKPEFLHLYPGAFWHDDGAILGISPRMVYALAAPAGPIPCYRIGRRMVFNESDVREYKESCRLNAIKGAVSLPGWSRN